MDQPQQTELLGLCLQELTVLTERLGEPSYRARQLFDGLYRQRWSGWEKFTTLPLGLRRKLGELGFAVGGCRSPLGSIPAPVAAQLRPLLEPYRERAQAARLITAQSCKA